MNRYDTAFTRLRREDRIAFIPFAVGGDPDVDAGERVLRTLVEAGADVVEIGYPFSDPIADGPVNQRAALRAIAAGLTPAGFFAISPPRASSPW
jgi:tryptophan synthase alpha chain